MFKNVKKAESFLLDGQVKSEISVKLREHKAPRGLVHNLLVHSFTLDSSKIEVFETYFYDIVTT